jgi:hypothetical protein
MPFIGIQEIILFTTWLPDVNYEQGIDMTEQEFRDQAIQDGYADPSTVEWDANLINEEHVHDFSARIFVLSGELKIVCADRTSVCRTGDHDALDAGTPHAEYVGAKGVRFLAARKSG